MTIDQAAALVREYLDRGAGDRATLWDRETAALDRLMWRLCGVAESDLPGLLARLGSGYQSRMRLRSVLRRLRRERLAEKHGVSPPLTRKW